jgi:phasin family protein
MMNYDDIIQQMNSQWGNYLEPARQINTKALEHWEKLAEYQIDMARRYSDAAVGHMREATTLQTPQEVQEYMHKGGEALRETADSMAKDTRTLAEMGQSMAQDMQKVMRDNLGTFTPAGQR